MDRRFRLNEGTDQLELFPLVRPKRWPYVVILAFAIMAFAALSAFADDIGFTIGKPVVVTSGYACDTLDSAILVADKVAELDDKAFDDADVKPLVDNGTCGMRIGNFIVTPRSIVHVADEYKVLMVDVDIGDGSTLTSWMIVLNEVQSAGINI